jgi:ABC-type transporter Mla MlaB component
LAALFGSPATAVGALRPPRRLTSIAYVISGSITRSEIPGLCRRVAALVKATNADVLICDVGGLGVPDAVAVDALARLQLTARRLGCQFRLRDAGAELLDLIGLMGLSDVVRPYPLLRVDSRRKAEEREQAGGVEEETNPTDPTV